MVELLNEAGTADTPNWDSVSSLSENNPHKVVKIVTGRKIEGNPLSTLFGSGYVL